MMINAPLNLDAIESWIFDLDNTIYPASSPLFPRIAEKMTTFIMNHFDYDHITASTLKTRLFRQYGTTLSGLMHEYGLSAEPYLAYVHDIDLGDIDKDTALDNALSALPGRKLIFTNGTVAHAERVLQALGIRHHFVFIFDIIAAEYQPKPAAKAYEIMISQSGINPKKSVMVGDMACNLAPAAALGMKTIWLNDSDDLLPNFVDHRACDLKAFLATL